MQLTDEQIREAARWMLEELEAQKLVVAAIPDGRPNSGRKIRVVVCPNPEWYSRFCQQYLKLRPNGRWKRPRTMIKRWLVLHSLKRIATDGFDDRKKYQCQLLDSIERYFENFLSEPHTHTHTHTEEGTLDVSSEPTEGRENHDW